MADVPSLLADLDTAITRTGSAGPGTADGGANGPSGYRVWPVLFNQQASEARTVLVSTLRRAAATLRLQVRPPYAYVIGQHTPFSADPAHCAAFLGYRASVGDSRLEHVAPHVNKAIAWAVGAIAHDAREAEPEPTSVVELDPAHLGTAAELERITTAARRPVKADTIRSWADAGKLTRYTIGGRTIFRLGDVLALAKPEKARPAA